MASELKVDKSPELATAADYDMTATTSVAAVGTTLLDILDVAEVRRAGATVARTAVYLDVVYEIRCHNKWV